MSSPLELITSWVLVVGSLCPKVQEISKGYDTRRPKSHIDIRRCITILKPWKVAGTCSPCEYLRLGDSQHIIFAFLLQFPTDCITWHSREKGLLIRLENRLCVH